MLDLSIMIKDAKDGSYNPYFDQMKKHIDYHIKNRTKVSFEQRLKWQGITATEKQIDTYKTSEHKELYSACKKHMQLCSRMNADTKKTIDAEFEKDKSALVLVHPFYLHLSHIDRVENDIDKKHSKIYIQNLSKLLFCRPKNFELIVMETAHHYAAFTSTLFEQGLIDKIIFTQMDSGKPMDYNVMNFFNKKNVYIAGGYNNVCLFSAIQSIHGENPQTMVAVKGLIIEQPPTEKGLLEIEDVNFDEGKKTLETIAFEKLYR